MKHALTATRRARWWVLGIAVAATAVGAYRSLPAGAQADAGANRHPPNPCGPVQLTSGENAQVSLLLPAVQRQKAPFVFVLLDRDGKPIGSAELPAVQNQAIGGANLLVGFNGQEVRVVLEGSRSVLFQGPSDGLVTGLLLPAVQHNGARVGPIAGTLQQFLGDGSVRVVVPFLPAVQ